MLLSRIIINVKEMVVNTFLYIFTPLKPFKAPKIEVFSVSVNVNLNRCFSLHGFSALWPRFLLAGAAPLEGVPELLEELEELQLSPIRKAAALAACPSSSLESCCSRRSGGQRPGRRAGDSLQKGHFPPLWPRFPLAGGIALAMQLSRSLAAILAGADALEGCRNC